MVWLIFIPVNLPAGSHGLELWRHGATFWHKSELFTSLSFLSVDTLCSSCVHLREETAEILLGLKIESKHRRRGGGGTQGEETLLCDHSSELWQDASLLARSFSSAGNKCDAVLYGSRKLRRK